MPVFNMVSTPYTHSFSIFFITDFLWVCTNVISPFCTFTIFIWCLHMSVEYTNIVKKNIWLSKIHLYKIQKNGEKLEKSSWGELFSNLIERGKCCVFGFWKVQKNVPKDPTNYGIQCSCHLSWNSTGKGVDAYKPSEKYNFMY